MVFAGITANNAAQVFKDFAAALPNAKLYGPDGVADTTFASPKEGLPADVAARTKVTIATLSPDQYPPEGRKFFDDYTRRYGEKHPDPYAIYGYEAMGLALDAIKRSKTGERPDVVKALFATKDRQSVLGTYSIDANGDTSLSDYGVYSIKDGNLVFDSTIKAQS
jgi:branched-chain amino acid transport system substrate-binding protein